MLKSEHILSNIISDNGIFGDGDWIESKDQDPSGDVRIIQLADIGDGKFINKSNRFMTYEKALELNCTFLNDGDILLARMPDPLGRACIYNDVGQKAVTVVDIGIIRPRNQNMHNQYLKFLINSSRFRRQIKKYTTGTTRKRISKKNLNKIKFELPNLDDQIHIANLLSQVESLIAKREESIRLLDELLKSTFMDMFGDPVLNPKGWEETELKNLMTIRRGASPRPIKNFIGDDIPWIKIGDGSKGNDLYIDSTKVKIKTEGKSKSVYLKKGSVVFANCGVSLGFARILKIDGCIHDGWLSFEDIDEERLNDIFLLKIINHSTQRLRNSASGGTQPNLNIGIMNKYKMILPPKSLQDKFVTIVQQAEQTKEQHQKSLQELKNLFGSLSQRAFSGELELGRMIVIKRQVSKYIQGMARSGAGDIEAEEVLDVPTFMRKADIDNVVKIAKSIDTEKVEFVANEVKELQKSLSMGDTLKKLTETAKLFKDIKIPSIKIDIPPFYSKIPSTGMESTNVFKTSQQFVESMKKRKEHIYQMLKDIPQIKEAIENGVLCKDDFLDVTLRFDSEYAEIKRIIMSKLTSHELAQYFDKESKSIKLVKVT